MDTSNSNSNAAPTMASIGQKLKNAREKKSLTLDQVQKQTRIHSTVLAALEEGRCDDILTPTYVKAFLKHYAGYLGLDSKEILKEYSIVRPEGAGKVLNVNKTDTAVDFSNLLYAVRIVVTLLIVFILIAFFGGRAVNFIKNVRIHKPARVIENKESTPLAKFIMHRKKQGKKITPARKETSSSRPIPKNEPLSLTLKTREPVLIQLKKDGIVLFKSVLPRGTVESIKADEVIDIYVAKAEAIELTLNGKPLNMPDRGVIKDLEITRKGVKIK